MRPRIFCLRHKTRRNPAPTHLRRPDEPLLTPDEARRRAIDKYGSVNAFAAAHKIHWQIIGDALRGKGTGSRGLAHEARVILGLKHDYTGTDHNQTIGTPA